MRLRAGALLLAVTSCAAIAPAPRAPSVVAVELDEEQPVSFSGPVVPAGTPVTIRLFDDLDTELNIAGDAFSAYVVDALVASDGSVVVPAGARVRGSVARVQTGDSPLLALDFGTVQTVSGSADLDAKIVSAEVLRVSDEEAQRRLTYPPATSTFSAGTGDIVEPRYLEPDSLPRRRVPEGDLLLPEGAALRLVLTRPIPLGSALGGDRR